MARPLRLEFEGAVYHVMSRGNERSAIFRDRVDREKFLELARKIIEEQGWILHGYCLMGNHFHLLLETPRPNLSEGMRNLNGRYTAWFNRRHRRSGHLLEGRFKGILVEKQTHLMALHRYIVLNPVRAKLSREAGGWTWSNYRSTAGSAAAPEWLQVDWTLGQFAKGRTVAQRAYREFVAAGKDLPSPLEEVKGQVFLGSPSFLAAMERRLEKENKRGDDEIPLPQRRLGAVDIERIRRAVGSEMDVAAGRLSRPRGGDDKIVAIYLARKLSARKVREIGEAFGVKAARVSNIVRQIDSGARPDLEKLADRIRAKLRS